MIKTIIFDNNGVLTSTYSVNNICSFLGLDKDKFLPVCEELAKSLDIGTLTLIKFHKSILKHFGLNKDLSEFRKVHLESFDRNEEVLKFAQKLKEGYELVLLTNFGDAFDECNKKWKLEEIFGKKIFVSYKLKMIKPDEDIYLYTLKKLGRKPEETVFIDDNKENVETARRLGMNAILFTDIKKLKQELEKYITI